MGGVGPLAIPGWVPKPIAVYAQCYFLGVRGPEDFWVLRNLISRPEMRVVWNTLRRRQRLRTRKYLYPTKLQTVELRSAYQFTIRRFDPALMRAARSNFSKIACFITSLESLTADECDQDLALARLFETAYVRATFQPLLSNISEAEKKELERLDQAATACFRLYQEIISLTKYRHLISDGLLQQLFHTSLEMRATVVDKLSRVPFKRSKGDKDFLRGYVLATSNSMNEIFGQRMNGLVARIANCVFPNASETAKSVALICRESSSATPRTKTVF